MNATPTAPLPASLKGAAIFALILSGLVGYASLGEALHLQELAKAPELQQSVEYPFKPELKPFFEAALKAQAVGISSMKTSRQWVLGLLWVATVFSFVGAMRLLRPAFFPRDRALLLLGRSTFVAALLRLIDGAQMTAIGKNMGTAVAPFTANIAEWKNVPLEAWPYIFLLMYGALTLVMVSAFLALSMYFRSEKVWQGLNAPTTPLA